MSDQQQELCRYIGGPLDGFMRVGDREFHKLVVAPPMLSATLASDDPRFDLPVDMAVRRAVYTRVPIRNGRGEDFPVYVFEGWPE